MSGELRSILQGTIGLWVAGLFALALTFIRGGVVAGAKGLRSTIWVVLAAIVLQAGHFIEEAATGFAERFPQMLDLGPWPWRFFLWFNLFWIAIWLAACWGLLARWRVALFPLWFLGVACVTNGIAHPALALRTGGYFPGLFTSPLVGLGGVLVLSRLIAVTDVQRGPFRNGGT